MSTSRRDERVYRAEFEDWLKPHTSTARMFRGKYVVEVRQWRGLPGRWGAMIDGDICKMLCFARTAAEAKKKVRGFFRAPLCDWVVGEKIGDRWVPVDEAREQELRRGA